MTHQEHFEHAPQPNSPRDIQLGLLRENLAARNYPNYPEHGSRLTINPSDFTHTDGRLVLPDGPWVVDDYPGQRSPERTPSLTMQNELATRGIELDAVGRPLHPWLKDMLKDPSIGVVLGKGAYWNWGPNHTADSIVVCEDSVLLIRRGDTGLWALPGGHVDPGEDFAVAGIREVAEETGLQLPAGIVGETVYQGPVADLRVTAHAWPETTAIKYVLPGPRPWVEGMDDAVDALWVPLKHLGLEQNLFGSHRFLLQKALEL